MRSLLPRSAAVLTLSVLLLPAPSFAGDKEDLARELKSLTGADKLGQQMLDAMMPQFAQMGVPQEFADKFSEKADVQALVDKLVPLYAETYDAKTLKAAIKFYSSAEGKRLVAAQPGIQQKAMAIGQQWGIELGQQVAIELQAMPAAEAPEAMPAAE